MSELTSMNSFFAGIDLNIPGEEYYYHVIMVIMKSRITLTRLLKLKISDTQTRIFEMRYKKVDKCHFDYLIRHSRRAGSIYLLLNRSRYSYHDFCTKINKRMETNLNLNKFRTFCKRYKLVTK